MTRLTAIREKMATALSRDEVVTLCSRLVRVASENPPGTEAEVAGLLGDAMRDIGMDVEFDEMYPNRPNVYGTLRGFEGKPTLVLNGHTDTVSAGTGWTLPPYAGSVIEDRLYGRGSADMKGGLAAMVLAVEIIKRLGIRLRGNLLIAAVVDEEVSERGTKHYMERHPQGDFAIVGEPTELKLRTAQKGQIMYELTVTGKSAHSSLPSEGINAISKMVKVIKAIEEYSTTLTKRSHDLLGSPTTNVGTITGGTAASIVPSSCTTTVDRRTLPGETTEKVDGEFQTILENLRHEDSELRANLKRFFEERPIETRDGETITKALRQSCKEVLDFDPGIHGFPATCDAGDLYARMPAVIFGPGSLSQAHRPNEYVSIKQVLDASIAYASAAIALLE